MLCRYVVAGDVPRWGWMAGGAVHPLGDADVLACVREPSPAGLAALGMASGGPVGLDDAQLLAPLVDGMEVWAAGVTYESSKLARMAESAGAGDFYARVYMADRPELFFKATAGRTVGHGQPVRIRADSGWNVPEPELTALISANGRILGYTVGNDMSSRDIEGANPLYLPQAKVYEGSCALGPAVVPAEQVDARALAIRLTVAREGERVFDGSTSTARMRRGVEELVEWLFRENEFPLGVYLLTGTGLIPADDFTLQPGDEISIDIAGIGTLTNSVERG
jgi:2-dehydro-3-deoxy-D-arabinonate dehydratase